MWLFSLAIRQPVFISMIMVAALVMGGISYSRMAVNLFPNVSFPVLAITTAYPGAAPEEVEQTVTKPLEEALGTLSGLEAVRSTSSEGLSVVVLEFQVGHPIDRAAADTRDRVAAAKIQLPDAAQDPLIQRFDPDALPILTIALAPKDTDVTPDELRELAEDHIKPRLERVEGVAAITVQGGQNKEIIVDLRLDALRARNLSPLQVLTALKTGNVNVPGGPLTEGNRESLVRTVGQAQSIDDLEWVQVTTTPSGATIYLRDLATIQEGVAEVQSYVRLNGKDAVLLAINKQSGSNTVEVSHEVKAELRRLQGELGGLEITTIRDESTFVEDSLHDLVIALLLGALAATIVVFLFFGDLRNTLVTVSGLPVIVLGTFAVMSILGFSLNMVSMMALSLSIGLLIDDAIVVRENIFRHMEIEREPKMATLRGTAEIAFAVIATTFSLVAVFVPVAFATGVIGMFFREFGLTVTVAVLISLLEAFTLAPMLSAHFFRVRDEAVGEEAGSRYAAWGRRLYARLLSEYRNLLEWSLHHRKQVALTALLVTVGSGCLAGATGFTFTPVQDQGFFSASLELPAGTALQETETIARYIEGEILRQAATSAVSSVIGKAGSPEVASFFVRSQPGQKSLPLMERLRARLADLSGVRFSSQDTSAGGAAAQAVQGRPVQLSVSGDLTLEEMDALSLQLLEAVRQVPGVIEADRSLRTGKAETRLVVDRRRAADLGLSAATLGGIVRVFMSSDTSNVLRQGDQETSIRVRLQPQDRRTLHELLAFTLPNRLGEPVPLNAVVRAEQAIGPTQIQRLDRERLVIIGADYRGRALGDVVQDVEQAVKDLQLSPGLKTRFLGQGEQAVEAFVSLTMALGLAFIFLYMVLASLFGSLIHPLTIMLSLPLSFGGAFLALAIARKPLDIMAMIGIIMLTGLVTKNAILLLDFILRLQREGTPRERAILTAGPIRLRPILMTTTALIFGMLPSAMALGSGSEFRSPMAITVIGGLITSTLLTLVVVPVFYTLLDDLQHFRRRRRPPAAPQVPKLVLQEAGPAARLEE